MSDKPVVKVVGKSTGEIDAASRLSDWRRIYAALQKDIEGRGLVIRYGHNGLIGKNPSVALALSVSAQIRRLQNDMAQGDDIEFDEDLHAFHKQGRFLAKKCGFGGCRCVGWTG